MYKTCIKRILDLLLSALALTVLSPVILVLIVLGAKKEAPKAFRAEPAVTDPKAELRKSINSMIWAIGLALYFIFSFTTGAWHITWIIFPLVGAARGLVKAIMDLKEAS